MLKYEIKVVEEDSTTEYGHKKGDKVVYFPAIGKTAGIRKDEEGHEYFYIPNMRSNDKFFLLFESNCIKDAVDAINDGDGDVIKMDNIVSGFGTKTIKVCKFLDRDYGELMRAKFIEGWKDTQFSYVINLVPMMSLSAPATVCTTMNIYNHYRSKEENDPIMHFDTKEEAQAKINEILAEAKEMAEKAINAESTNNIETENKIVEWYQDITAFSVIGKMFYDIYSTIKFKNEPNYILEIGQAVRQ